MCTAAAVQHRRLRGGAGGSEADCGATAAGVAGGGDCAARRFRFLPGRDDELV